MWHRPDLLNRVSNALFALAFLLIAYGALAYAVRLPAFGVRRIEVLGAPQHITREQVQAIVNREMRGTFFTLNLPTLRRAFEKLPWVREVNLRRQWPDRLEVTLVEHVPLARWGTVALVNTQGELFEAAYDGKLPTFAGPPGSSKEIAIQYEFFKRSLAAINAVPTLVQVSPRRAWEVRIENGPMLAFGREDIESRLARFIAAYERTLAPLNRRIDYVDLRYGNGFAVRIPELKGESTDKQRVAAGAKKATRGRA